MPINRWTVTPYCSCWIVFALEPFSLSHLLASRRYHCNMNIVRPYTVHPSETKMYRDLKQSFWWKRMKVDVSKFVAACEVFQCVKDEHKRPTGLLNPLEILEWKWEHITMDFVVGLPRSPWGRDAGGYSMTNETRELLQGLRPISISPVTSQRQKTTRLHRCI